MLVVTGKGKSVLFNRVALAVSTTFQGRMQTKELLVDTKQAPHLFVHLLLMLYCWLFIFFFFF